MTSSSVSTGVSVTEVGGLSGTVVGDCAQALNSINTTTNPKMVNLFFAVTRPSTSTEGSPCQEMISWQ